MDKATKAKLVKRINRVLEKRNERLEIHRTLGPLIFNANAALVGAPAFTYDINIEALAKKLVKKRKPHITRTMKINNMIEAAKATAAGK
jgi:hypothetical protein